MNEKEDAVSTSSFDCDTIFFYIGRLEVALAFTTVFI